MFYRSGAEEARGAHNSEDVGSKPTSGIYHHIAPVLQALPEQSIQTSLAQRQSTRLITSRSIGSKPSGGITQFGSSFFHFIEIFLTALPALTGGFRNETAFIKHKLFKPLPWRTFYRLTPTLLPNTWYESRMVIFLFITRTVWDRYLQVVTCQAGRYKRSITFTGVAQG